jgi:enoyl-CoA hydratase/carnithine racemase
MAALPEFKTLVCNQDGPIFTITLNRPEKLNAFNDDMFRDCAMVAEAVSNDNEIRVVVFTGTGRAFSSGADLTDLRERRSNIESHSLVRGIKNVQGVFDRIEEIPKPTVAAINGHAVGAGLQLALACDFRIVAKGVKLGLSDVKIGIIPALGATTRLPGLIGLAKTKELILKGDLINPEEALEIGLVSRVVEGEALDQAVRELTEKLVSRAPLAMSAAKNLLNSGAPLDRVAAVQSRLFKTADAREGIQAFLEKRTPRFRGE